MFPGESDSKANEPIPLKQRTFYNFETQLQDKHMYTDFYAFINHLMYSELFQKETLLFIYDNNAEMADGLIKVRDTINVLSEDQVSISALGRNLKRVFLTMEQNLISEIDEFKISDMPEEDSKTFFLSLALVVHGHEELLFGLNAKCSVIVSAVIQQFVNDYFDGLTVLLRDFIDAIRTVALPFCDYISDEDD